ncbi:DUF6682 family protein [Piscinibacter sakaiensis]|uniref:Conserved phage protein n=1 Tax=Piscinibacter sakaiensis TaxID=1547922 RepID=A0A0K8P437_PISS1|nr:DUF6682 family protein [Piscinibacter sakaiensis]GAP37387.1 conserved phage protein [Piscinibacter sakaiensis]
MGTILASAVITTVRRQLRDPAPGVFWTDPGLLDALNRAERQACELKPELLLVHGTISLAAGTQQALPLRGRVTMRLDANVSDDSPVRLVDRALLDVALRTPQSPALLVRDYSIDDRDPRRFTVEPPNNGSGALRGLYAAEPQALALPSSPINLDDIHEPALVHGVLSEAYAMAGPRQDPAKASTHWGAFMQAIGVAPEAAKAAAARYGRTPGGA